MGELVDFPSNGHGASGYLAIPESGSGPGLIVIQEWWGLVPHITDVCDRFAAEGCREDAPEGPPGEGLPRHDPPPERVDRVDHGWNTRRWSQDA